MNTKELIQVIYQEAVENGVTSADASGWIHVMSLKNGMVIDCRSQDEGYTHTVCVKGLVSAFVSNLETDQEKVSFWIGDEKGLLSVARLLGLTFKGELV
jgi:hypothetical protein